MKSPSARLAAILSMTAILLGACSTAHTRFPIQHYVPVSRSMEPLGELDLNDTSLRLAGLEGEMKLQYAGQMPEAAGEDLAGASVYRVTNWQKFFDKNADRKGYCMSAPRWVAVNSKTGAPAWSNEIWVGLLTLENWSEYTPTTHGYCAGGSYVRAGT